MIRNNGLLNLELVEGNVSTYDIIKHNSLSITH